MRAGLGGVTESKKRGFHELILLSDSREVWVERPLWSGIQPSTPHSEEVHPAPGAQHEFPVSPKAEERVFRHVIPGHQQATATAHRVPHPERVCGSGPGGGPCTRSAAWVVAAELMGASYTGQRSHTHPGRNPRLPRGNPASPLPTGKPACADPAVAFSKTDHHVSKSHVLIPDIYKSGA